jgi:hypothetical protein
MGLRGIYTIPQFTHQIGYYKRCHKASRGCVHVNMDIQTKFCILLLEGIVQPRHIFVLASVRSSEDSADKNSVLQKLLRNEIRTMHDVTHLID